jgi:hypothetical protein
VKSHEAVGPYEVMRVAGEDPKAMAEWLSKNGYKVPASFEPVLAAYVREKFDFLALRLRPGQSASAIRPVRVELQGGSNVVPMRASAAGPTDKLGITMYVVSESQAFVPSSYPVFTVPSSSITWDFAKKKSDYAEVREARAAESGYRAWELVGAETKSGIGMRITVDGKYEGETAEADRQADVEAFGVAPRMITHLRANVRTSELTSDVVLEPVGSAPTLTRTPSKVSGAPPLQDVRLRLQRHGRSARVRRADRARGGERGLARAERRRRGRPRDRPRRTLSATEAAPVIFGVASAKSPLR